MADASSSPCHYQPPPPTTSRRLPPPCWSHDETVALIDAYRDKWYSLRRGNLRANHWQEVADSVADMSPLSAGNPQKTSVQCRHKMEKLRKRYRSEIQRSVTNPNRNRYSSWVHFSRMNSMEKGPSQDQDEQEDEEDDDDLPNFSDPRFIKKPKVTTFTNGVSNRNGLRVRFPGQSTVVAPPSPQYPNFGNFRSGKVFSHRNVTEKKEEGGAVAEFAAAIKSLGDSFVRVERMKMEMVRELEGMRMEMEIKRTQIILDSQQMVVKSFVNGLSNNEHKKTKTIARMESFELGHIIFGSK